MHVMRISECCANPCCTIISHPIVFNGCWWYHLIFTIGGMDYMLGLELERALTSLSSESHS